jgi:hypothetical protein
LNTPARLTVVGGSLALFVAGCGTGKNYANNPRPPVPIVVAAAISPNGVSVSPSRFGAGLIQLVVTNLTNSSQQLTLESRDAGGRPAFSQQTGPINPQDTASLSANLVTGVPARRTSCCSPEAAGLSRRAELGSSDRQGIGVAAIRVMAIAQLISARAQYFRLCKQSI